MQKERKLPYKKCYRGNWEGSKVLTEVCHRFFTSRITCHLSLVKSKRFNKLSVERGEARRHAIKCFIVDDSDYHKTGNKIEFIGKIFDHVSHRWSLGFKLLTLGFWDGVRFNKAIEVFFNG